MQTVRAEKKMDLLQSLYVYAQNGMLELPKYEATRAPAEEDLAALDHALFFGTASAEAGLGEPTTPAEHGRPRLNMTRASKYHKAFGRLVENKGAWDKVPRPSQQALKPPSFVWEGLFTIVPEAAAAAMTAVDACLAVGYLGDQAEVEAALASAQAALAAAAASAIRVLEEAAPKLGAPKVGWAGTMLKGWASDLNGASP